MLLKSSNCLALAKTILQFDIISSTACECCSLTFKVCIHMKGCSKCAECTCCDCPCVLMFLESLNCVHKKLKSQLNKAKAEHAAQLNILQCLNLKILCLCTTIRQNKLCAVQKAQCVAAKLDSDNDEIMNDETSSEPVNFDFLLQAMSFSFFNNLEPSSQTAEVFLHSWVSFLLVFTCFLRCHILFTWWDSGLFH